MGLFSPLQKLVGGGQAKAEQGRQGFATVEDEIVLFESTVPGKLRQIICLVIQKPVGLSVAAKEIATSRIIVL